MENEHHRKYLTLQDRIEIQECISRGMTFKAVARRIRKDPTTVSRKVQKHVEVQRKRFTRTAEACPKLLRPSLPAMAAISTIVAAATVSYGKCNTFRNIAFTLEIHL